MDGPFRIMAIAGPITYTLALPRRFKCSHGPEIYVDRLKSYYPRDDRQVPPGPVASQEGEHVVE